MKQTKSLLGIIAGMFAVAFVLASCKTEISIPTHTVTYSSAHGSVPDAISVNENTALSEGQLPALSDDNASFAGWYCGNSKVEAGYVVNADLALTARWEFTVTYSSQYGTAPSAINVEENSVLSADQLPELSDDAAVFKGWYAGDTKAVPGEYQATNNVTLTARWSQLATITYHSKFGTVPESFEIERNQTLVSEKVADITCSPYTFLGWFDSEDDDHNGTGEQINAGLEVTGNIDLYAKWKKATVSFSTEYGTIPASITRYSGEVFGTEVPSVIDRDYYTPDGWFNGSTKLTSDYVLNDDAQFTAKWRAVEYDIDYRLDGGSLPSGTALKFTVEDTVALATPTKEGKIFGGWYTENSCYPDSKISGWDAGDRHEPITVYALWGDADSSNIYDLLADINFKDYRNKTVKNYVLVGDWTDDDMVTLQNAIWNHDRIIENSSTKQFLGKSWLFSLDLSHIDVKTVKLTGADSLKEVVLPWTMTEFECYLIGISSTSETFKVESRLIATMLNTSGTWEHLVENDHWEVTDIPGPASWWGGFWRKVN